ncbi:GTPase Era [Benzoatithermus flavus]|uniref:GTPase Era n=1 Tax=Benzoatithermus flavus TaxID=3108223 RepID=A0ABU8XTH9_9PROT
MTEAENSGTAPTRAGFVAIIGAPNVGKSTLLNRLVGTKVSIVSPKVQTTRRRIIGITIEGPCQILFVDTPGIFAPKRRLESAMVKAASVGITDADLVLLLLDARKGIDANARLAIEQLRRERRPAFLVVNKIDAVPPERALPLIKEANEAYPFEATWIVSALNGDGCADLLRAVAKRLPEGPWLFPEDQLSDLSDRALAAEITREQIFLQLHQELPYSVTVETEGWAEAPDGSEVRIDQTIYVLRESQKPILIGRRGQQLKAIGEAARRELEKILEKRVHLFLFVKVRENWLDDPERYREMGLDFER